MASRFMGRCVSVEDPMRGADLSDDELWQAIAGNTDTMSELAAQQLK